MSVPDPLPLRSIEVPREVSQAEGCSCAGLEWHAEGCAIWLLPDEQRRAAIVAALGRERAFTAELNRKLREQLPGSRVTDVREIPDVPQL
jgi:hypothetical protein